MNLKLKFLQQQLLTIVGIFSMITAVFLSIYNSEYWLLAISFFYSQVIISLVGTQIVLHRYFSHGSFKVNNKLHVLFCILSILPGQGSSIAWAAAHRHHHKHSDQELDNHSPNESYFLAAGGWLLKGYQWVVKIKKLKTIPVDLLRDSKLVWVDKYYYNIWWALILFSFLINFKFTIYFLLAPIGWTLLLSSLVSLGCHIKLPGSYKNFNLHDNTHNNLIIQCIVLGDALHNNHHASPKDYDLKIKNKEFDIAGKIIKCISIN
jgi:stearoyl-CoA desaturase (delta-9 desaturase)